MVRVRPLLFTLLLTTSCWSAAAAAPAPNNDDRFLAGVVSAYLDLHFGRTNIEVEVEDGRLWLDPAALDGLDPQAVRAVLEGVRGLEVVLAPRPAPARRQLRIVDAAAPLPVPGSHQSDADLLTAGFLPEQELFEGPLADPRSPSIGGALVSYQGDEELGTVGRVDFGGTLPL
jgi:hypothetical protein